MDDIKGLNFMMYNTIFKFEEFVALKRAQCGSIEELLFVYPAFEKEPELVEFLKDIWENIKPVEVADAFNQSTDNRRRCYFEHLGVVRLMESLEKKLVDTYVHSPAIGHTYELYAVSTKKMKLNNVPNHFAAVKMTCPSTYKEHWLWVDHREDYFSGKKPSAREAVAWLKLQYYDTKDIVSISRQGEVFVDVIKPGAVQLPEPIHMKADDYFRLLDQET